MSDRDRPIGSEDIKARIATLEEYLKDAERDVQLKESDLWNAKQSRDRLKAEIEALKTQLDALGTRPIVQKPQPIVTQFTKADGSVWIKERTGNTARIYPAH